jgi:hypothetical protein
MAGSSRREREEDGIGFYNSDFTYSNEKTMVST